MQKSKTFARQKWQIWRFFDRTFTWGVGGGGGTPASHCRYQWFGNRITLIKICDEINCKNVLNINFLFSADLDFVFTITSYSVIVYADMGSVIIRAWIQCFIATKLYPLLIWSLHWVLSCLPVIIVIIRIIIIHLFTVGWRDSLYWEVKTNKYQLTEDNVTLLQC